MKSERILLYAWITLGGYCQGFSAVRTQSIDAQRFKWRTRAEYSAFSRVTLALQSSKRDNNVDSSLSSMPPKVLSISMVFLPVASLVLPTLLGWAKSLTPNSPEQLAVVTALLVANRAYLYLTAATIVGLAATRGANDPIRLGRRVVDLTEELVYRPDLSQSIGSYTAEERTKPSMIDSLANSGVEECLDEISSETQALILPLLVSFLLALSAFLIPFWSDSPLTTMGDAGTGNEEIRNLLANVLPTISQIWNVGLLTLFTRSEFRRLLAYEFQLTTSALLEWGAAATIMTLASIFQLWQAQNFVNMALAILVARAIQFDKLAAIIGALGLLTVYDATSVFLIPAAGASDTLVTTVSDSVSNSVNLVATSSEAAGSAMGSVAIQKLTSGSFQPGLLVTKIGNRLGGSLGLGDAVFPSILACFVQRFDNSKADDEDRQSLFWVSMGGYLLGCGACEFAPMVSSTGLPALLFIIPIMLVSVLSAAALGGELEELISFDPKSDDNN